MFYRDGERALLVSSVHTKLYNFRNLSLVVIFFFVYFLIANSFQLDLALMLPCVVYRTLKSY